MLSQPNLQQLVAAKEFGFEDLLKPSEAENVIKQYLKIGAKKTSCCRKIRSTKKIEMSYPCFPKDVKLCFLNIYAPNFHIPVNLSILIHLLPYI